MGMTAKEFVEALDKGRKDFRGEDLYALDLSETRVELADLDFSGANLVGAKLRSSYMRFIRDCDFSGANLAAANLAGCRISRSTFRNACLAQANRRKTTLSYADFAGVDLTRARMTGAEIDESDFSGAVLRGAILFKVTGRVSDLRGADLSGAQAEESSIQVGLGRLPWAGPGALVPAAGSGLGTRDIVASLLWTDLADSADMSAALMEVGRYQEILEDIRASCEFRLSLYGAPGKRGGPSGEPEAGLPEPDGP